MSKSIVPFISFDVEILDVMTFDTMVLHPLTRLSEIRRILEQHTPPDISLEKYWFTQHGKEHLKEWRTLWDLDVFSGSTLYMRGLLLFLVCGLTLLTSRDLGTATISVVIRAEGSLFGDVHRVDVEEDETFWGLKERYSLITGIPISGLGRMVYREKRMEDWNTLKEAGLVGGETLFCQVLRRTQSLELYVENSFES